MITYDMLYYTILYYTMTYYTILYYTILYYTTLYYTTLRYTILYYTILHYTILYYDILYYTILHYTTLYYNTRQSIMIRYKVASMHRSLRLAALAVKVRAQSDLIIRYYIILYCGNDSLHSSSRNSFSWEVLQSNRLSQNEFVFRLLRL